MGGERYRELVLLHSGVEACTNAGSVAVVQMLCKRGVILKPGRTVCLGLLYDQVQCMYGVPVHVWHAAEAYDVVGHSR